MTGLSGAALEHFERLRKKSEECLSARGTVCAGSGCLSWSTGKLTMHTDYGRADQDKDTNQDFALAWVAADDQDGSVRWAIALADGVTSSWYAEYGAEIACWTALAAVAAQDGEALVRARGCR